MQKLKIEIDNKFIQLPSNALLLSETINQNFTYDKIVLNFKEKPNFGFTKELFYSLWQSHSIEVIKDKLVIYDKSIQGLIEIIGVEFNKNVATKGI